MPGHPPGTWRATALVAAARHAGVRDQRVLEAIRAVRRERFVPPAFAGRAHTDEPLPIPHGQVTTQPSLVALMIEALALTGRGDVLEVGTGLGYQSAVLSHLAQHVWSIEWWADLAETARANLTAEGIHNVTVVTGDGRAGLPDHAPYEAVVVAAAAPTVPPALVDQLAEDGRLVQPLGPGGDEDVTAFVKRHGVLAGARLIVPARFVPLVGRHGSWP